MEHASRYAIGIDVGGTKIAGGLVDLSVGTVVVRYTIATAAERGGAAVLHDVRRLAATLANTATSYGVTIAAIGLGVCELVDPRGNITSAHTIDWIGTPVSRELAAIAPAVVEADVRAHALAEAAYGVSRDIREFVFVAVGTGISSCLVLDGKPHAGTRGNALILASSPLTTTCTACGTELQPTLETFASGPALVTRYNQAVGTACVRAEAVFAAAYAGDEAAMSIIRSAGQALGVSLGWLVGVLDPQALVMGGGLGVAEGPYWDAMVASTRTHIWANASRDLPIVRAKLGIDAGIIGAALAAARASRN